MKNTLKALTLEICSDKFYHLLTEKILHENASIIVYNFFLHHNSYWKHGGIRSLTKRLTIFVHIPLDLNKSH